MFSPSGIFKLLNKTKLPLLFVNFCKNFLLASDIALLFLKASVIAVFNWPGFALVPLFLLTSNWSIIKLLLIFFSCKSRNVNWGISFLFYICIILDFHRKLN